MPDKKTQRIHVVNNLSVLRKKYTLLTYREARRYCTSIYNALISELLEDGYTLTAAYFVREIKKEQNYYREHVIAKRLRDMPELLFALYDKCRMAEHAARKETDLVTVTKLLYQIMLLLQRPQYKIQINWLLEDVYEIIIGICRKLLAEQVHPRDQLCRIYFNYAVALSRDLNNYELAIRYFEWAFEMSKSEEWSHDVLKGYTGSYQKLYYAIADEYLETIFKYISNIISRDLELAHKLLDKAIVINNEVFIPNSIPSLVSGLCQLTELYSEQENFLMAKAIIPKIEIYLEATRDHSKFILLNLNLARGAYYGELYQFDDAMQYLNAALNLAILLDNRKYEAMVRFHMGNLYLWKGSQESRPAIKSYKRAAEIFDMLGNDLYRQKCICKIGKMMVNRLFPMVLQLMKTSDTRYCQIFYLRRWKTLLTPFWVGSNNILRNSIQDGIECLLK